MASHWLREFGELSGAAAMPLVILSRSRLQTDDPRLAKAGIAATLLKPLRRPQLFAALNRAFDLEQETPAAPASSSFDSAMASRMPLKIILADDSHVNQKVGVQLLQRFGYRCTTVGNGLETIAALEVDSFDLLFLDVQMPELDGYETARRIRQKWSAARPRIIAMTGSALPGDREKCLEAGMDDYIARPVRMEELRRALERWGPTCQKRAGAASASLTPDALLDATRPPSSVPAKGTDEPLLDLDRLKEMAGDTADGVQELAGLYLTEASQQIQQMGRAIESKSAAEVAHLAHKCFGASATCGMTAILPSLRELERLGHSGRLSNAQHFWNEANEALDQLKDLYNG